MRKDWHLNKVRIVKTRKDWTCERCHLLIPTGTECFLREHKVMFGRWRKELEFLRYHIPCGQQP